MSQTLCNTKLTMKIQRASHLGMCFGVRDAIALALRADCPIYVAEQVMQTAKLNTSGPPEGPTAEQLRGWLEGLNDEDLGRYKM